MFVRKRGLVVAVIAVASAAATAGPASASMSPNPYSTGSGTGSISTISALGTSSCSFSNITASGTGNVDGASLTITGFTAFGCRGVITAARLNKQETMSINRGTVTVNTGKLFTTILGTCLYVGTLTGTMPNGGNSAVVSGTLNLFRTLSGFCSSTKSARRTISLPGVSISW